jgi:hypothetical protein
MKQSTFEFWSNDRRSLIESGRGLWRYLPNGDGTIDFFTAYTYRVRWGLLGKLIDRLFFRPLMKWATERSFDRLARRVRALSHEPAEIERERDGQDRRSGHHGPVLVDGGVGPEDHREGEPGAHRHLVYGREHQSKGYSTRPLGIFG